MQEKIDTIIITVNLFATNSNTNFEENKQLNKNNIQMESNYEFSYHILRQ